jgi:DNA invertase Pin-like site-specific DNA recombinase
MERDLKAERAAAGRSAALSRGKTGGMPKTDPKILDKAKILYEDSDYTAAEVCKTFGIGSRNFCKYLEEMNKAELEAKHQPEPDPAAFGEDEF